MRAKDGRAIVSGMVIPAKEMIVLDAMNSLNCAATVNDVITKIQLIDGSIVTNSSVRSYLERLSKRGCVVKTKSMKRHNGSVSVRNSWKLTKQTKAFFEAEKILNSFPESNPANLIDFLKKKV